LIIALLALGLVEFNLLITRIGELSWMYVTVAILTMYGAANVMAGFAKAKQDETDYWRNR
jgi:hypothetical protein